MNIKLFQTIKPFFILKIVVIANKLFFSFLADAIILLTTQIFLLEQLLQFFIFKYCNKKPKNGVTAREIEKLTSLESSLMKYEESYMPNRPLGFSGLLIGLFKRYQMLNIDLDICPINQYINDAYISHYFQ